jgi:hypothetical protein
MIAGALEAATIVTWNERLTAIFVHSSITSEDNCAEE